MRRIPLLLLFALLLAAATTAAAQTTPRRPPADTVRFGATRPAAGDSITLAEYDEEDADSDSSAAARPSDDEEAEGDTVPRKPREGPYSRAGGTGPFSVQASGETAARPPRGEVVWVGGRAARPAADSARRDTARAGTGQRVASGQSTRRDTASASTARPTTRRDTASTSANRPTTRRDTASTTANRPTTRRDTTATAANRPTTRRDTTSTGGRTGSTTATSGRTGSSSTTTNSGGRTGTNSGAATSRARSHTVAAGETFYGIARRYGVTAAQLRAVNPDVEMEQLEIGDVLRLPASARDSRAGASSTTQAPRTGSQSGSQRPGGSQAQRRTHTVVAGETLFGIARRYGVTVDAIRQANEMETDQVRTGQRLTIPPAN